MALTIETGAGVVGANSYVTLVEIQTFISAREALSPLPADSKLEALAIRAIDYLEGQRDSYKGSKVNGAGYLQWPRKNVVIDGFTVAEDEIPKDLKSAQCQLVIELNSIDPLLTVVPGEGSLTIKREKIDVIETEYFLPKDGVSISMPKVDAYLAPLCRVGFGPLQNVRV